MHPFLFRFLDRWVRLMTEAPREEICNSLRPKKSIYLSLISSNGYRCCTAFRRQDLFDSLRVHDPIFLSLLEWVSLMMPVFHNKIDKLSILLWNGPYYRATNYRLESIRQSLSRLAWNKWWRSLNYSCLSNRCRQKDINEYRENWTINEVIQHYLTNKQVFSPCCRWFYVLIAMYNCFHIFKIAEPECLFWGLLTSTLFVEGAVLIFSLGNATSPFPIRNCPGRNRLGSSITL